MPIPYKHSPVTVDGVTYDLSHLDAFAAAIPGKGIGDNKNLEVMVVFSNHVFTERTKYGEIHHVVDHHETKRTFEEDRYEMSKVLGAAIKIKIEKNELTFVSKSFGGIDNLVFIQAEDGRTWTIVYCLEPIAVDQGVRMEILSSHPKSVDQRKISRNHLSFFARKCLFENSRVPN